jgi:hypothetical protein
MSGGGGGFMTRGGGGGFMTRGGGGGPVTGGGDAEAGGDTQASLSHVRDISYWMQETWQSRTCDQKIDNRR